MRKQKQQRNGVTQSIKVYSNSQKPHNDMAIKETHPRDAIYSMIQQNLKR